MLRRIYIDNFRSLVNFEFRPTHIQLILGDNGSGKSSLFEALDVVREVVVGERIASLAVDRSTLTRWEGRKLQTFELNLDGNGGEYVYRLQIQQYDDSARPMIHLEKLDFNGNRIFSFSEGIVQIFSDDYSAKQKYTWEGHNSFIHHSMFPYSALPIEDMSKLLWFLDWMKDLCLVSVDPQPYHSRPDQSFKDFTSWFKTIQARDPESIVRLSNTLSQGVISGFKNLYLSNEKFPLSNIETLHVNIARKAKGIPASIDHFEFEELSGGQATLVKLYALALCLMKPSRTILIDDPVQKIALPEIQPWLLTLLDRSDDIDSQVILTSHHPELINYLACRHGVFFRRDNNGPVRVDPVRIDEESRLEPSELIARGWVDG